MVNVVAATNSQGTARYLHGPMGLLAQQDAASAWDWPLTDGLGSIRAVLDGAGNPLHAMHYAPYGEPFEATGTPQMPHGFTGEPTDGNGLVYLRARYYVPGLGVFPSLDPVEEGNRYSYAKNNPCTLTDPTGFGPNESEIGTVYDYSCNCGWIDWHHVAKSDEQTYTLIDDLKWAAISGDSVKVSPFWTGYWAVYFGIPMQGAVLFGGSLSGDLFHSFAVVPHKSLEQNKPIDIALSIFMDANMRFEEKQGQAADIVHLGVIKAGNLRSTYFSEEDLVSDLIGFYIGKERNLSSGITSSETLQEQIKDKCGVLTREEAVEVFRDTYHNGADIQTNWKRWYPRLTPLVGCQSCKCLGQRTFPTELSNLPSKQTIPQVGGVWWWMDQDKDLVSNLGSFDSLGGDRSNVHIPMHRPFLPVIPTSTLSRN